MSSAQYANRLVRLAAVCLGLGAGCAANDGEGLEREVAVTVSALGVSDCPAGTNIIQGNSSPNTLTGTAGDDCILGLGGNDTLYGLGGNDFLIGGPGQDTLYGGDGNDTVYGEAGDDVIEGGIGDDWLYGGIWTDTIRGGAGNDRIFGEADADFLYGDAGDDIIDGAGSADVIEGGDDNDVIQGGSHNDTVNGGNGNDAIIGGTGVNTIDGGSGTDSCLGTSCELAAPVPNGCTSNAQCTAPNLCIPEIGVCLPQICADSDGDGTCDASDLCPNDALKIAPGLCGCEVADTDSDADGTPNCNDVCEGFDDSQDADGDSVPDGCDNNCPPGTVVHQGDATLSGPGDLNELVGVGCITGSLSITQSELIDLSELAALQMIEGSLVLADNALLTRVDGLDALSHVRGTVLIEGNDALLDLEGLSNLSSVSSSAPESQVINIRDNASLPACWSWLIVQQTGNDCDFQQQSTYNECWGNTGAGSCGELPAGFVCEAGASGPGVYDSSVTLDGADGAMTLAELGGVSCITGTLDIAGSELSSLARLSSLRSIGGDLIIADNTLLTSVDGLDALSHVRGTVLIEGNDALLDLEGLSNLSSVSSSGPESQVIRVRDNASLPACWSWLLVQQTGNYCSFQQRSTYNECWGNTGAGSCGELPSGFVCEAGASGPGVYDSSVTLGGANGALTLAELGGVSCITGTLDVDGSQLADLAPLSSLRSIGANLIIADNALLTSVDGLNAVTRVGGTVLIEQNDALLDLSGLSSLSSVSTSAPASQVISIRDNESLPACWSWLIVQQTGNYCGFQERITYNECWGNTGTGSCGELPPDFVCEPGAVGPGVYDGYLSVWGADEIEMDALGGIACVTEGVFIGETDLTHLDQLASLRVVGSYLDISDNDALLDLSGLENLESALELIVSNNPSLPQCWVDELADQLALACTDCSGNDSDGSCARMPEPGECVPGSAGPGVYDDSIALSSDVTAAQFAALYGAPTCVTGDIAVSGAVTDLTVLASIEAVGGDLSVQNAGALTSLHGLESLVFVRGDLAITNNDALADLDPLANVTYVGGVLRVSDNDALASLQGLAQLESLGVESIGPSPDLRIFDNPSLPACWVETLEAQSEQSCYQELCTSSCSYVACTGNDGAGACGGSNLPPGFVCEPGATGPGVYDGNLDLVGFGAIEQLDEIGPLYCVTGALSLAWTLFADLEALSTLEAVGGEMFIGNNDQLVSVDGLNSLVSIGGSLWISSNQQLVDLGGFESLVSIGTNDPVSSSLVIDGNWDLPTCWVAELENQTGLGCGDAYGTANYYSCTNGSLPGSCGP